MFFVRKHKIYGKKTKKVHLPSEWGPCLWPPYNFIAQHFIDKNQCNWHWPYNYHYNTENHPGIISLKNLGWFFGILISPIFSNPIPKLASSVNWILSLLSLEESIVLLRSVLVGILCFQKIVPEFFLWITPGFSFGVWWYQ